VRANFKDGSDDLRLFDSEARELFGRRHFDEAPSNLAWEVADRCYVAMVGGVVGYHAEVRGLPPLKSPREAALEAEVERLRLENGRLKSDITSMIQIGREATR
jgi:hypothetical protein